MNEMIEGKSLLDKIVSNQRSQQLLEMNNGVLVKKIQLNQDE
jgi:hypothetical protein